MTAQRANWGRLAVYSLISTIVIAIALYLILDEHRWVAGIVLGLGAIEAVLFALVLPRFTGAEDVPVKDGDWGVPPSSEPAETPPAGDPLDD
jgi:hypothetical protein